MSPIAINSDLNFEEIIEGKPILIGQTLMEKNYQEGQNSEKVSEKYFDATKIHMNIDVINEIAAIKVEIDEDINVQQVRKYPF